MSLVTAAPLGLGVLIALGGAYPQHMANAASCEAASGSILASGAAYALTATIPSISTEI